LGKTGVPSSFQGVFNGDDALIKSFVMIPFLFKGEISLLSIIDSCLINSCRGIAGGGIEPFNGDCIAGFNGEGIFFDIEDFLAKDEPVRENFLGKGEPVREDSFCKGKPLTDDFLVAACEGEAARTSVLGLLTSSKITEGIVFVLTKGV